jgi:hypothetical protein
MWKLSLACSYPQMHPQKSYSLGLSSSQIFHCSILSQFGALRFKNNPSMNSTYACNEIEWSLRPVFCPAQKIQIQFCFRWINYSSKSFMPTTSSGKSPHEQLNVSSATTSGQFIAQA